MNPVQEKVTAAFEQAYGSAPAVVVRAPGRVNLIGEHTDYNDGFVLPMAIDRALWIALRPRDDRQVVVGSVDFDEAHTLSLDHLAHSGAGWAEYIKGMAWALREEGFTLGGWEGVLGSDIPIGAGLSSSAAIELATARAFAAVSGFGWEAAKIAKLAQKAENQWVGVNSGIMDQMISAAGQAGYALLIDCRSLDTEAVPLPRDTAIVIMDTGTRRGLVDSAYNERREQCEAAARFFEVVALRDVDMATFEAKAGELDDVTRRRARHVISENARTLDARTAMQRGDAHTLGQLMNASHDSLRDDFEVSSVALNLMVDIARAQPGCLGARMTGAGFGGCAVALVQADQAERTAEAITAAYRSTSKNQPSLYICQASDGAQVVDTAS